MMKPRLPLTPFVISILGTLFLIACSSPPETSDLGGIYNQLAQHEDPYRNPIVLIPGILGSKLTDPQSDKLAWGTFGFKHLDPTAPEGARLISLPMQPGMPLGQLQDGLKAAGTLDNVVVNLGGYPVVLNAYAYILGVLGVGGYRDQQLGESGEVAIDHLKKSLQHAHQFMRAMDLPAEPPASVRYYLVAGDSENTDKTVQFDHNGRLKAVETAPGDAVVLRSSALLDERRPENRTARLISPIKWDQVIFLFSDHRNITKDPEFTDNLLYILLESP